nr:hypothetical protein [Kibdelosporangium sp. MJ126-NF4]CTQ93648.1 hypothetical protein [Kibdelosporangium sp. MJ126-NF4]
MGSTTFTETAAPPSATTSAKPQSTRPKSIDLKAVPPCSVVEKIIGELGFAGQKPSAKPALGFKDSEACLVSEMKRGFGMQLIHAMNFNALEYGATAAVSRPVTMEGYPALVLEGNYKSDCYVAVDVADKQMFYVQWTDDIPGTDPPMSELCANATKAAAAAMKVLVSS